MKRIPLGRTGLSALVDNADYDRLIAMGNWTIQRSAGTSYAVFQVRENGIPVRSLQMHQEVLGRKFVDHVNGDGLDNRRANLRPADHSTNGANRRLGRNNTSGFKGIYRHKNRWQACIHANGTKRYLGSFLSPVDAAHAYDVAARELFGEYARLNFPA